MAKEYKVRILKNGEKRYIFDVNIGYRADGSRIRKTVTSKSIKDGRKKVAELTLNNNGKTVLQKNNIFSDVYDLYIVDCKKRNLSQNTLNNIEKTWRKKYKRFEGVKLNKIKDIDIIEWIKDISNDLSPRTVKTREGGLNSFFNWCLKRKYIDINPFIFVNRTKVSKPEITFWTEEQFEKFISTITHNTHNLIFTTLFYTGLRKSELCGLDITDLDIKNNELHLSHTVKRQGNKTIITTVFKNNHSKRIVPIPDWLTPRLEEFMKEKKYPFKGCYTNLNDTLNNYIKDMDLPKITVHGLRHSYISMLISKGVELFTISQMAGHNDIKTTSNPYGHLYSSERKRITSLFKK